MTVFFRKQAKPQKAPVTSSTSGATDGGASAARTYPCLALRDKDAARCATSELHGVPPAGRWFPFSTLLLLGSNASFSAGRSAATLRAVDRAGHSSWSLSSHLVSRTLVLDVFAPASNYVLQTVLLGLGRVSCFWRS